MVRMRMRMEPKFLEWILNGSNENENGKNRSGHSGLFENDSELIHEERFPTDSGQTPDRTQTDSGQENIVLTSEAHQRFNTSHNRRHVFENIFFGNFK